METVTSTRDTPATGLVAVSEVGELYVTLDADVEAKETVELGAKLVPVIPTIVPPTSGPPLGLTAVTVGTAH